MIEINFEGYFIINFREDNISDDYRDSLMNYISYKSKNRRECKK